MYPRSSFRSGGTCERTLVPVVVPGEHQDVPSFQFSFQGNIRQNHPFGKPPFCQPLIFCSFWDFPDCFGTFPTFSGIFPICSFPPSRLINSTCEERSRKGPRHDRTFPEDSGKPPRFSFFSQTTAKIHPIFQLLHPYSNFFELIRIRHYITVTLQELFGINWNYVIPNPM